MAIIKSITHDDRDLLSELKATDIMRLNNALHDVLDDRLMVCASCQKTLGPVDVSLYDHSGGVYLIAALPKQWVSVDCKCGYQTSLNKLRR